MKSSELRLPLHPDWIELLRSFVREAALAENASLTSANLIASDAVEAWLLLSASALEHEHAHVTLSLPHRHIRVRIALHGHGRTERVRPLLGARLRSGADMSCQDSGVDSCEVILSRSLNSQDGWQLPVVPADQDQASFVQIDDFQIGLATRADAAAIARCFLAVYGHHYIHRDVYSPQRYWRNVENGELIPVVARDGRGEVIGHLALEREPGALVAERGEAVVLPAYRGHHLLERMSAFLSGEAIRQGLSGIYSEALTIHTFSQQNDERSGMALCAALLGANPESFRPMDVSCPTAGQRQSYLRNFIFVQKPAPRTLQLAGPYQDVILGIYDSLGVAATVAAEATALVPDSRTRLRVNDRGYGVIRFEQIGRSCDIEVRQAMRDVLSLGARSIQLSAPISDPGLPQLIVAARELGFFLCGLGPAFFKGEDLFLLQFLSEPLDIGKLQIHAQATKQLLAFIDEDRKTSSQQVLILPR